MALDKKQIALTVGGIIAGLTLTYLLYRLEQQSKAASAANADASTQAAVSQQYSQQVSLPTISVPTISSTPSTTPSPTDTSNQGFVSATDPALAALLASIMSQDNSAVTSTTSPVGSITELPFSSGPVIPPVVVPQLNNFSSTQVYTGGSTAQPVKATFKHISGSLASGS